MRWCAQQPLDALGSQAPRNAGRWCELEQSPQPGLVGRRTQLKGLHVEAVKLVAQAVGKLIAFALQVLVYAREFPELDHLRIVQPHAAKAGLIGV
jgi:hypothetical protein